MIDYTTAEVMDEVDLLRVKVIELRIAVAQGELRAQHAALVAKYAPGCGGLHTDDAGKITRFGAPATGTDAPKEG